MDNPTTKEFSPSEESPPSGFSTIEQIRSLSTQALGSGVFVNLIGILKDQQVPFQTSGRDAKYTLELVDYSIQGESRGLKVVIFRPMGQMPALATLADIVIVRKAKAQTYLGAIQLMTHYSSEFHFLSAAKIPRALKDMKSAPWSSYPRTPHGSAVPSPPECRFAAWLHSKMDDLDLPSDTEFKEKTVSSMNVKDKFSLLQDIRDAGEQKNYVNIIGEVVKIHDGSFGTVEIYVSDYTANSGFFNYVWGAEEGDGITYDEYGYVKPRSKPKSSKKWPGPYGRMSIQISLWEPHAAYVREEVKVNSWVLLSNVRIKIGKQGFLEGGIHEDDRVKVNVLEPSQGPPSAEAGVTEVRLHEAIKRKFAWTKRFKQQQDAIRDEENGLGSKQKRGKEEEQPVEPTGNLNSKQKRKLDRAAAEKRAQENEIKKRKLSNLNQNIRCSFPNQEPVSIKEILKPQELMIGDKKINSPFTNTRYRANVRVVDYFPARIEDFAVGYRSSEFDVLEDYSGAEDTDPEGSRELWQSGQGFQKNIWEWRFALQVEDAEPEGSKDRMWLMVDNSSAQMLLNLPNDATSLRGNPQQLSQVKEQLFKLWGDLEEQKSAALPNSFPGKTTNPVPSSFDMDSIASSPPRRFGGMPISADSDEENPEEPRKPPVKKSQDSVLEERDANIRVKSNENTSVDVAASNKGFACCIQQYGIKMHEKDPTKANAGNGKRWQRMFGLFGTVIL